MKRKKILIYIALIAAITITFTVLPVSTIGAAPTTVVLDEEDAHYYQQPDHYGHRPVHSS